MIEEADVSFMSLSKPALDPLTLEPVSVNRTTLPPGKESSMRHWHTGMTRRDGTPC
jgi:uncharacterized cupin superfamily protein